MSTGSLQPQSSAAWASLTAHAEELANASIPMLLAEHSRYADCSMTQGLLVADYSRRLLRVETLALLEALADERELAVRVAAMLAGETVNNTEGRAALHMALRGTPVGDSRAQSDARAELDLFLEFADAVRSGAVTGTTGQQFRTVVNIGIGGSDLGPRLVARALAAAADPLKVKFVAGVDGIELADALVDADPATTLFIVCSKTFTTLETRTNADAALAWLRQSDQQLSPGDHFCAVSTNSEAMDAFGIRETWRFRIWDWVGGRFSVWSAIGLAAAIAIGSAAFREFLAGARAMDAHFLSAPFAENVPILLGMLDIWEQNFLGKNALVVLPYDQRLEGLPDYLQQLYMESQGKAVDSLGHPVQVATGVAVWGAAGSHAQHSFAQWLHQGSANVAVEYVGVAQGPVGSDGNGQMLALANMLAQADALALGRSEAEVREELRASGLVSAQIEALVPHKMHPGSRSSLVLVLKELTPQTLGALLAHYEHRVFVQAMIWGINPFDQWGVELGKLHAKTYAREFAAANVAALPGIGAQILAWGRNSKA